MDMSYADGDRISKLIETGPKVTLQSSYKSNEELRELIASDEGYAELWGYATRLEGLIRNVGVHAAGVVIGDRPWTSMWPLPVTICPILMPLSSPSAT